MFANANIAIKISHCVPANVGMAIKNKSLRALQKQGVAISS
jgi:hypothetical protein